MFQGGLEQAEMGANRGMAQTRPHLAVALLTDKSGFLEDFIIGVTQHH